MRNFVGVIYYLLWTMDIDQTLDIFFMSGPQQQVDVLLNLHKLEQHKAFSLKCDYIYR